MAELGTVDKLVVEVGQALLPLREAVGSPDAFLSLLHELGWTAPAVPQPLLDLGTSVDTLYDSLTRLLGEGGVNLNGSVGDPIAAPTTDVSVDEVTRVLAAIQQVVTAIRAIATAPDAAIPASLRADGFKALFPRQLIDFLIIKYLLRFHPSIGFALRALGVIKATYTPSAGGRESFMHLALDVVDLPQVLTDPSLVLKNAFGWGEPGFDYPALASQVDNMMMAFGLDVHIEYPSATAAGAVQGTPPDPFGAPTEAVTMSLFDLLVSDAVRTSAAVRLMPVPAVNGAAPGMALLPSFNGELGLKFQLGDDIVVTIRSDLDLQGGVGLLVRPGEPIEMVIGFESDQAPVHSRGSIEAVVDRVGADTDHEPTVVLGAPDRTRLQFRRIAATGGVRLVGNDVDAFAEFELRGLEFVFRPDEADGFIAAVVPSEGFTVSADLTVGISHKLGFYFRGASGLEIQLPARQSIGPVEIQGLSVSVSPSGGTLPVALGASFATRLGPVTAVVDRVGLQALFAGRPEHDGNLGPIDVSLRFAPPTGVGLSIDAGPASGGGFLSFKPERQEYAGALELQFGTIGVKAIGLLSTGPGDWSLLLLLYAQIPPIEIGFGFMLEGIGGMIGLQRGVDITALIAGMKTKEFDDILFPADPVGDAPRILNTLRTLFPARAGALTIGPMVDVGWGTPRIVFIRVAVLLQLDNVFGSSGGQVTLTRVVLVGQVRVAIGRTDDDSGIPIVLLIVDIVGFWDLADKRYGFLAVLRDSHITGIDITGGLGVWGEYGDHSRFLLAAGGFNPRFHDVPTEMSGTLDRLGASFSVGRFSLVMTGYFALTPATLQAGMNLVASAKIGPVGLKGEIGFDVLVYRTPRTHFIADFRMTAEVTYHGHTLAGVKVTGTLEGPGLWHLKGEVTFSILWWDISKSFNESWGIEAALELTLINLQTLLTAELTRRENWSAQLPEGAEAMVTLAPHPGDLAPRAHPLGRFVFSQRVTPLGLTLEKYGDSAITGPNHFEVTSVTLSGTRTIPVVEYTPVGEHFARAQFLEMTDEEKLTRPSFEEMDAGVEFSSAAFEINAPAAVGATMEYETAYYDFETGQTRRDLTATLKKAALDYEFIEALAQAGAAARAPQRASEQMRTKTALRIAVGPPPLAATDRSTFAVDPTVAMSGQAGSVQMIAEQRLRTVGAAGSQIVEAFELAGA